MISRFIQTLAFSCFAVCLTMAQATSSFYVKVTNDKDVENVQKILSEKFPQASVSMPFSKNTFEKLNHIVRIDGNGISADDISKVISWEVDYVEAVPISKISYTPNDLGVEFGSPNQWYLHKVNAKEAWDYSKGNPDIVIAVVDNAFLTDHVDLESKRAINPSEIPGDGIDNDANGYIDDYAGWNARSNSSDVYISSTNSTHGTHVAGIAAAETDNDEGMASLSFLSKWLPVRVADDNDNVTHGYEGIEFAATRGAHVINCSWGSLDSSATAKSVINFALSQNCFVVASSGNFSNEVPIYPATYHGVISVAATTISDVKLNTSNFGSRINISAPGSGIWSTTFTVTAASDYGFLSGTSMASPLVASQLALMRGYAGAGNNSVILDCLYNMAEDINDVNGNQAYDSLLGRGRIDAQRSMDCLKSTLHLSLDENETVIFSVFPNPTASQFSILLYSTPHIENTSISWNIKDISGKEIITGKGTQGDLSILADGIYFLSVFDKKYNKIYTQKIIKK